MDHMEVHNRHSGFLSLRLLRHLHLDLVQALASLLIRLLDLVLWHISSLMRVHQFLLLVVPLALLLLPRPVFNMASGTTLTTSTKVENETSPIFPARVEIIQGGGFEKPQLSSRKNPNWILAKDPGAHGGSRDLYLRAGF